jgi:hypothetical protein
MLFLSLVCLFCLLCSMLRSVAWCWCLGFVPLALALDNGLAAAPAMGYSTWNDCSSFRDNGKDGWCVLLWRVRTAVYPRLVH